MWKLSFSSLYIDTLISAFICKEHNCHSVSFISTVVCCLCVQQSLLRKSPVLKRSRSKRSYVGMRATGIRAVDELLRTSVLPIKEGTDLRDDVRVSLSSLMEACHLAQTSSVKQCVRTLYSRVQQCEGASLAISLRDEVSASLHAHCKLTSCRFSTCILLV